MRAPTLKEELTAFAALGYSRAAAARELGMNIWTFRAACSDYPSIKWPTRGESIRRARNLGGTWTKPTLAAISNAQYQRSRKHWRTLETITGTLELIVEHFAEQGRCDVDVGTVRRRLRSGAELADAVFSPSRNRAGKA